MGLNIFTNLFLQLMESNSELSCSLSDFKQLVRKKTLPPKMQAKLSYLQALIAGRESQMGLSYDLPDFEKISLKQMNMETKVSLFNSIVRCLAGRELIAYFSAEKAWIKPQGSKNSSTKCYLFLRSDAFKVSRSRDGEDLYRQIMADRLIVQKTYKKQSRVYSFTVGQKGQMYRVKISEEGVCARVHGQILKKVWERRNNKAQTRENEQLGLNQVKVCGSKDQDLQFQEQEIDYEGFKEDEERGYLRSLGSLVQAVKIQKTEGFQMIKNTEIVKLMVNKSKNEVKVMLNVQSCSVFGLIQSYVQFGAWNVQVETFRVVNRIRRNTFLGYFRTKKQGMFLAAREAYLTLSYFKECKCSGVVEKDPLSQTQKSSYSRNYLVINSVDAPVGHNPNGAVAMSFNQVIEFSQAQDRAGWVCINILSKIDFKVWECLHSSTSLGTSFMGDVGAIGLLCMKRDMLKSGRIDLFDYDRCKCMDKCFRGQKGVVENGENSSRKYSAGSDFGQASTKTTQVQSGSAKPAWSLTQVLYIIDSHNRMMRTDRIVSLITSKTYQKYYLRQRFQIASDQQPYVSSGYSLRARENYLGLGSSWKLNSSEDYVYVEEEELKIQKGVIKLVVKQVTAHVMAGKSIMTMSLPVQIFDNYSALEAFARIFGFVPVFMHQALLADRVQQQIKYVGLAFMSMSSPMVHKPFNPILGQTFEGVVGGIRLYFQQTSHHPPISTFLMKSSRFEAYGSIQIVVDLGLNSARTKIPSPIYVKIYGTNTEYVIRIPDLDMDGVMFGSRTLKLSGLGFVVERRSGVYLQWSIGKAKKGVYEYRERIRGADLAGGVFEIKREGLERLLNFDRKKVLDGVRPEQMVRRCSVLSGKWYGDAMFDGVVYKSFKNGPFPVELERPTVLLPSDCSFRLDIVYRRWKEYGRSNEQKEVLQNAQRSDCKLREKYKQINN